MPRICDMPDCTNPHMAKGLCNHHYYEMRRDKDNYYVARKDRISMRECTLPGCNEPQHQAGLCQSHYHRQWKYGDPYDGETPQGERLRWLRSTVADLIAHPTDECVIQPFGRDSGGYGEVSSFGKSIRMHEMVLILTDRMPPGREGHTRHLCGEPSCVNPEHIVPGTAKENAEDRIRHGRVLSGESHPGSKLTNAEIQDIRDSTQPQIEIADQFGISPSYVSQLRSGTARNSHRRRM